MKKLIALVLALVCVVGLVGCATHPIEHFTTIEGNRKTYRELSDGTWEFNGHIYKYRLEVSGRMHNAAVDSTFVFLSNIETITFEQAWKAAGFSSNLDDYFAVEDAVLVGMKNG